MVGAFCMHKIDDKNVIFMWFYYYNDRISTLLRIKYITLMFSVKQIKRCFNGVNIVFLIKILILICWDCFKSIYFLLM